MFEKLKSFINELKITPQKIFEETSETIYQVDSIVKKAESLIKEIQNLNLNKITIEEQERIESNIEKLTILLKDKLH